jgi:hypothetical protein
LKATGDDTLLGTLQRGFRLDSTALEIEDVELCGTKRAMEPETRSETGRAMWHGRVGGK